VQAWPRSAAPNDDPTSWPLNLVGWQGLPTSPAALKQAIVRRFENGATHYFQNGAAHDIATFAYAAAFLQEDAPPAVRAALFRVIERLPGVKNLGPTTDHLGRRGLGVGLAQGGERQELIFDPATSRALEEEIVAVGAPQSGNNDQPAGTVLGYTVYVTSVSAVVDSLGVFDVVEVARLGAVSSTSRNRSWAVVPTRLTTCCDPLPGTVTLMRSVPCDVTVAPLKPAPFTRLFMIETAVPRAGDPVQVDNVGPGQVAAGAAGRGPYHRHPEVTGVRQWAGRLPGAVAGRPITECPGQLAAPRRCVDRVNGPHGVGGPDGAVEQRGAQRGHQPRHPRRDHSRPAIVVDGLREVADPLRQPVVVAERLPPLEPGRHYRVHRCPARPGEPARPAVDVFSAVEHGQRLAGHGSVVDKAVRQLEAGRRHPLERLVQRWRRVAHIVLLLPPVNPCRSGSRVEVPLHAGVLPAPHMPQATGPCTQPTGA
jgi:hypothetical protein